jgi:hypothetical protein
VRLNRNRLGVAVGKREIRALLLRSGVIEWRATVDFAAANGISESLRRLLERAPRSARRARISVAVSPAWVQVKPLSGLPAIKSARLTSHLLQENQQAFFLYIGRPALVADIQVAADAPAWGAAFDRDVLDQLLHAVRALKLRVASVIPTVVAIVAATPSQALRWTDGDDSFELEGDGAGIRRLNRVSSNDAPPLSMLPEPLACLDNDAPGFLGAYAAAVAPRRMSLSWKPQSDDGRRRVRARVRRTSAAVLVCAASAFAGFGPGLHARNAARDARMAVALNRRTELELRRDEGELRRATEILSRIESFSAERGRVTRILAGLAESIPDSTALLTFHVDSVEGAFTAIAPQVADVLPELANVREIVAPRILGSVTREVFGVVRVERATFRFRRPRRKPVIAKGVAR